MTTRTKVDRRPYLALTMGDPAGIGPEVLAKALAAPEVGKVCHPVVIGSRPVMAETVKALRLPLRVVEITEQESRLGRNGEIALVDPLEKPLRKIALGRISSEAGAAAVAFIKMAVKLALADGVDGIVTGPINKEAIQKAGYDYPGHTELLAELTGSPEVGMMILGGPLKVMFVTTHVALRHLPDALNAERIGQAIRLADKALREFFKVAEPRIGVAALNPHAGEHGLFGEEERDVIRPAVRRARAAGIEASDPLPADTLFGKAAQGRYDGVVAMYHDQGLIPLKLVAFGKCVNLTVGLPIIRTSVDHGTAFDIAGQGRADPGSFIEAIKLAARLARERRRTAASLCQ